MSTGEADDKRKEKMVAEGWLLPDFGPVIEKANQVLDQVQSLVQDVRRYGLFVNGGLDTPMGRIAVDLKVQIPQG